MTRPRQILKIIFLAFSGVILTCLAVVSFTDVNAQNAHVGTKPIQRTIEVEGEESFSRSIPVGSGKASSLAIKAPLYGLIAIILVLVAVGAIYYIWVQSSGKIPDKTSGKMSGKLPNKTLDSPKVD